MFHVGGTAAGETLIINKATPHNFSNGSRSAIKASRGGNKIYWGLLLVAPEGQRERGDRCERRAEADDFIILFSRCSTTWTVASRSPLLVKRTAAFTPVSRIFHGNITEVFSFCNRFLRSGKQLTFNFCTL